MQATILLFTKVTSKPVLSFLTWTLLTCTVTLHQPRVLVPSEQSPEASAVCRTGSAARKKLPYLPDSHFQLQPDHILEVSIGMLCFSSASFQEKSKTKEEGRENHKPSHPSSFTVVPLVLTLTASN